MKMGEELKKKLSKIYEPASMVELKFKGKDVAFKTDEDGFPVLLFIGKKDNHGVIHGERFRRNIKKDDVGNIIKDHWDMKGKAS